MNVEKPSSGAPCGDERTPHPVGVADLRTDRIRIAGSPLDPSLLESEVGPLLVEFLEDRFRAGSRFEDWVDAGADVLVVPTLCATPARLKPLGLAHRTAELNRAALEVARRAAEGTHGPLPWVAGQVGSLGSAWRRGAFFNFDEAFIHYHEQAKGLILGQPDIILVRQITDLRLLRAALTAIRELWDGLVMVLLDPARLRSGGAPTRKDPLLVAAEVISSLGVQGFGVEGADRPAAFLDSRAVIGGQGFSLLGAALPAGAGVAPGIDPFARAGVDLAILEGRAGLASLRAYRPAPWTAHEPPESEPLKPASVPAPQGSPQQVEGPREVLLALEVEWEGGPPLPGGPFPERSVAGIDPGRIGYAAVRILEHSEGLAAGGLRRRALEERVAGVEASERRPLLLVARDPLVLEAALKGSSGRPIAYLDSSDPSLWQSVFFLASRYGAKLAVRLAPAASRPSDRGEGLYLPALLRLLDAAEEYGLRREDLFVDPLGFDEGGAPGWQRASIDAMLRQMPWARRETGVRWILGCHRFREEIGPRPPPGPVLQTEILSIALFQGLDAVVISREQPHLLEALAAYQGWEARGARDPEPAPPVQG